MVHGRFQPFHLGHLELLRAARSRFARVLVGITNADASQRRLEPADPTRSSAEANPFTYLERATMIEAVLRDEGGEQSLVVPFPVSQPELWPDYVPAGAVHVLRVFDEWGRVKADRLRRHGQRVIVLDEGASKGVSGTEVRRRLREGGDWRALVPEPVARVIDRLPDSRARDLRRPA